MSTWLPRRSSPGQSSSQVLQEKIGILTRISLSKYVWLTGIIFREAAMRSSYNHILATPGELLNIGTVIRQRD